VRQFNRLREKILGTELHRLHRCLNVAVTRQDDHRRLLLLETLQDFETGHARELQIQENDFRSVLLIPVERRLAGGFGEDLVA